MKQEKIKKSEKKAEKAEEIKKENEKKIQEDEVISETEELRKQLENYQKLAEERLNQLKYLQADFDNYRKQFEKEKEQIIRLANENLIRELLIILDDFESSIKLIKHEETRKGIELLHQKFFKTLEKHGLRKIEALGKKFDPNFHEVLCEELSDKETGSILEEIQKGYCLLNKVMRPSKVKVASNKLMEVEVKNGKEKDD